LRSQIGPSVMAMRVSNSRALASALRSSRAAFVRRNEPNVRFFGSTPRSQVMVSSDQPNMRHAQRAPDDPAGIHAPLVNPADKYQAKADDLHQYGSWQSTFSNSLSGRTSWSSTFPRPASFQYSPSSNVRTRPLVLAYKVLILSR
jgi:hypothetical protein